MLYLGLAGEVMQGIAYYYHFGNIKYVHFIHRVLTLPAANLDLIFYRLPKFYWMFNLKETRQDLARHFNFFLFA